VTEPTLEEFESSFEATVGSSNSCKQVLKLLYDSLARIATPVSLVDEILSVAAPLCSAHGKIDSISQLLLSEKQLEAESLFGRFLALFCEALYSSSFTVQLRLCKHIAMYMKRDNGSLTLLRPRKDATKDALTESGFRALHSRQNNLAYLQREAETIESLVGILPRHVITERIDRLSKRLPLTPQVHFLSYLVCLHHGDYVGALHKLHQYFDHVLVQQPGNTSSLLPYATLNLAAVHLRFGHIDEALELVREVTASVQRRKDDVCLARTLSLLFRLAEHRCDQTYQLQLLQQTLARSLSLSLSNLSASTMLDTAKHYLLHPREVSGLATFSLVDNIGTNGVMEDSLSVGMSVSRPDAVWRLIQASMSAATRTSSGISATESTVLASEALVSSAQMWSIYGDREMSKLSSHLQLDIHRHHNLNSVGHAGEPEKSSSLLISSRLPTKSGCASLCSLAKMACESGSEREALVWLLEALREYPQSDAEAQWLRGTRQILFDMALRRGDVDTAEMQAVQLGALSPLNLDLHHHIDALFRLCLVLVDRSAFTRAHTLMQALIETCEASGLTIFATALRLTQAEILMRSQAPPFLALHPLLNCLQLATQFRMHTIAATAATHLAHIHLSLATLDHCTNKESTSDGNQLRGQKGTSSSSQRRHAIEAINLIDQWMPHILQHAPAMLQAQAKLELTKATLLLCTTAQPQQGSTSDAHREFIIDQNLQIWDSSYADIEDIIQIALKLNARQLLIEAYYFKARLANALGKLVQRNVAAKMFKTLQIETHSDAKLSPNGSVHYYIDAKSLEDVMTSVKFFGSSPSQ